MADFLPRIQLGNPGLKLTKPPLFGLDVGGDGFRAKKGLRAP